MQCSHCALMPQDNQKTPPFIKFMSHIDTAVRMRVLETVIAGSVQAKQHSSKDTSNNYGTIYHGRGLRADADLSRKARYPTINVVMNARDRRWSWLGHVLRIPEHRLVRQVLLNCVKPALLADVLNLCIENATKMSKDRKLWSCDRPSLRCRPLSGRVAIK